MGLSRTTRHTCLFLQHAVAASLASYLSLVSGGGLGPNNAFKPTPHRGANHMAGTACHVLHAPLRRGLTWVLGAMSSKAAIVKTGTWLYGGSVETPVDIISLDCDWDYELNKADGRLEEGEEPIPLGPDGCLYYVRFQN